MFLNRVTLPFPIAWTLLDNPNARHLRAMLCAAIIQAALLIGSLSAAERLELDVREIGGIRRHEPLNTVITLPKPVPLGTAFRLLLDGMPVNAQFRSAGEGELPSAQWWIDFSTALGPFERSTYVVEYGSDVQPFAESPKGHVLRQEKDVFVIENAPYITWKVPRDLAGLVRSVDFPPNEHLRPNSRGLVLRDRAGGRHPLGGAGVEAAVLRSGTRAVALRFRGGFDEGPLAGVRWTTDLIFPSPVSWVEVICTVDDRDGTVAGVGAELNMALDPPKPDAPTLVDVGAWTQIYAALAQNEIVELRAEPLPADTRQTTARTDSDPNSTQVVRRAGGRSSVFRGPPDKLRLVAANFANDPNATAAPGDLPAPEGWLHVMDRKRCLALAVDRFAQDAGERLTATADGAVGIWRDYAGGDGAKSPPQKTLRCWLHFVHFPPQYSAATSPRMMQTPPVVYQKPR